MTKSEYLKSVENWQIQDSIVDRIEKVYSKNLPELLQRIVSHTDKPFFFDDGTHILSYTEVLKAEEELGVAFPEKYIIPVVDCCDGNYIVYDYQNKVWAIYNIIDDIIFNQGNTLYELF